MEEPNTTKKKGPNPRNIVLYVLLGLVLVALVGSQLLNFGPQQEIDELYELLRGLEAGNDA